MNKRGQFFLLAAVIISAIIISLGVTSNKAVVQREPDNFYDFSYEVKSEIGAVMDYEIVTYDEVQGGELDNFVELLADDIKDQDPDTEFIFVFGSNDGLTVTNYGEDDVLFTPVGIEASEENGGEGIEIDHYQVWDGLLLSYVNKDRDDCISSENCEVCFIDLGCYSISSIPGIKFSESCVKIPGSIKCITSEDETIENSIYINEENLEGLEEAAIIIDGEEFEFAISDHEQITLIMKKNGNNESYYSQE